MRQATARVYSDAHALRTVKRPRFVVATELPLSAADPQTNVLEEFLSQLALLPMAGTRVVRLYGDQPPAVRPRLRHWPTRMPSKLLEVSVDCRPAHQWL